MRSSIYLDYRSSAAIDLQSAIPLAERGVRLSEQRRHRLGEAAVGCAVRTETAQHTKDSRCAWRTLRFHANED